MTAFGENDGRPCFETHDALRMGEHFLGCGHVTVDTAHGAFPNHWTATGVPDGSTLAARVCGGDMGRRERTAAHRTRICDNV